MEDKGSLLTLTAYCQLGFIDMQHLHKYDSAHSYFSHACRVGWSSLRMSFLTHVHAHVCSHTQTHTYNYTHTHSHCTP